MRVVEETGGCGLEVGGSRSGGSACGVDCDGLVWRILALGMHSSLTSHSIKQSQMYILTSTCPTQERLRPTCTRADPREGRS
jgi:hypothetical protein